MSGKHIETLEGIHRTKHLLQWAAIGLEFVTELIAVAHETMSATRQPLPINLVSMPQSRLHHAIAAVYLQHQTMQVGHEIFFNFWEMRRHDAAE